jgi:hypothetical protein
MRMFNLTNSKKIDRMIREASLKYTWDSSYIAAFIDHKNIRKQLIATHKFLLILIHIKDPIIRPFNPHTIRSISSLLKAIEQNHFFYKTEFEWIDSIQIVHSFNTLNISCILDALDALQNLVPSKKTATHAHVTIHHNEAQI